MEYMVLRDGSIKVIKETWDFPEISRLLMENDGVMHYWYASSQDWYRVHRDTTIGRSTIIPDYKVPEVIRLMHMLE